MSSMRSSEIETPPVILREIIESDIEQVRQWRNRPDIAKFMLSKALISPEQQKQWYQKICVAKDQQHFLIFYKNEPIGVANIKSEEGLPIDKSTVLEAGIYIADERYRNTLVAFLPAIVLNDYCFDQLACEKLHAVVVPENHAALRFNRSLGYKVMDDQSLITMCLSQPDFRAASEKMRRLFR